MLNSSWLYGREPVLVGEHRHRQGAQGPALSPCRRRCCCRTELSLGCLGCVERKTLFPTLMKGQTILLPSTCLG